MSGEYIFRTCFVISYLTFNSFKKQFSTYLADGIGSEDIEEIYTNAYAAIREDPTFKPTEKTKDWKAESKKYSTPRLTLEQRKAKIQSKIEAFKANGGDAAEEDEEEDEE
jgi:large subunit ribosomal protein L5e